MRSAPPTAPDVLIHLRSAGVSLLVDVRDGMLPSILHWGADLGPQTFDLATDLAFAAVPPIGSNCPDAPVGVSLLPAGNTGFTGRPGLSGSRDGRSWSPKFRVTEVRVNQQQVSRWIEGEAGQLQVDAVDDQAALRLELSMELTTSGLMRCQATIVNDGPGYTVDALTLALPVPERAVELLDLAGRWSRERTPQRSDFVVGAHVREGRRGRTGADAATVLHAGTAGFDFASGEIWAVHTGWSGNHLHYAELTADGIRLLGGGELLLPGEVRLEQGQSYRSPWVYGAYGIGLDAVAHQFHTFVRARPQHPTSPRLVTFNAWEAVYFNHDAAKLIELAERAAELGVERFVLDDGWFGSRRDDQRGLGDWVVSPQVWPQGLHPLVNRVRELGMQFGLWFEPEMVNEDSEVARAHPEWIMAARRELPIPARHQQVLNLTIPEAYCHVRDQMLAILAEYDIGYIKWDHNRDLVEAGDRTNGGRPAVHAQTAAVYRLLAELARRHPGLEIESCSSGGGRVDLGIIEHTHRVWTSDCIDPLERQSMLWWSAQLLPPEMLGSHIASGRSHTTGRTHDLNFRAATAVFGHLGVEWDLTDEADEAELAELADWISFYKRERKLLHSGSTVRMDGTADGTLIHGVVAPDRSRALFVFVMMANPLLEPQPRFVFRGLDESRVYHLRPVLVGRKPSGLRPPPWWGQPDSPGGVSVPSYPGIRATGASLMSTGVRPPGLHPDQAVVFALT